MEINLFKQHLANIQKKSISESVEIVDDSERPLGSGVVKHDAYIVFRNSSFRDRSLWLPNDTDRSIFSRAELKNVFRWYHQDNPKREGGLAKVDLRRGTVKFINKDKFEKMGGDKLPNNVWGGEVKIIRFRYRGKKALDHAK